MSEVRDFVKKEFVVILSGIAMLISCAIVPVSNYTKMIDTNVLGTLFSLMLIIAGFSGNNLLKRAAVLITRGANVNSTRKALFVIAMLTFVLSMLVTNDAALIALVPITIIFFADYEAEMIYAIVVQTVAANIGSMATPFGNPQNLFLYSAFNLSVSEFFRAVLPTALVGLAIVLVLCVFIKDKPLVIDDSSDAQLQNKPYLVLYGALFVICLLAVFKVLSVIVAFASVCVVILITEPKRFTEVDFGLLLTFVFFFIFVGNIKQIPQVSAFLTELVDGREFFAAVASSQVISNVPASMMLSGFTDNWRALILGTDVGGLGTPVASLASLISIRFYGGTENARHFLFLGVFLLVNLLCLAAMYGFVYFTQL